MKIFRKKFTLKRDFQRNPFPEQGRREIGQHCFNHGRKALEVFSKPHLPAQ
jgi:hypothetical protein